MIGMDTELSQIKKYKANTLHKASKCSKKEVENIGKFFNIVIIYTNMNLFIIFLYFEFSVI